MGLFAWLFCRHRRMQFMRNVILAGNGESQLRGLWMCPDCALVEYREVGPSEVGLGKWIPGTIPCPACGCQLVEVGANGGICPLCATPRVTPARECAQ